MKDCSSCKYSPLNNSKLAGKTFEETPCQACVIEDQRMTKIDPDFVQSCANEEYDEILHGHISSVAENSFNDDEISRVELFRIMRKDLLHTGKMSVLDDQILEIMSRAPLPSMRAAARSLKIPIMTMCRKWDRLKRLLSREYAEKYEKVGQFSS